MTAHANSNVAQTQHSGALVAAAIIVVGLAAVVMLARRIDAHRPAADPTLEEAQLYLTGTAAKHVSLGFDGLVADWYWMRSLQYVGRKIIDQPEQVQLDSLGQLNLRLLAPLLDTATTLDPQFMEPYEYAAVVLPDVDVDEAIRITKKGIAANPAQWRLYQHLGYIYWQLHDYKLAAETYEQGSKIPGVPAWMEAMRAHVAMEGGSRGTAREIYTRMYEQSEDTEVKEMARRRLWQVDSLDQRDLIRRGIVVYKNRVGHCPSSWKEMDALLRVLRLPVNADGAPLDPAGTPYLLVNAGCDVDLDPKSDVPNK